jgi:dTDP-4-amino-4,6-dideoxygalactose transaminase
MKVLQHTFTPTALDNILQVIQSGDMGFGSNVGVFENALKPYTNKTYNIALNSASAAAFIVFAYLKEKYGSCDVFVPSLTFTSPVWAAKHFGHNIIFVDVDDQLLFNLEDYRRKRQNCCERYTDLGIKIVVMPTLYGGVSNIENFDSLYLDNYNEIVVVDAAHCPHPTIKSDFVFTSFHPTKPICSPDGGMLSTDIEEAAEYFRSYRNFGRQPSQGGYDITQEGFKFYMNNLSATIALESLKTYKDNLANRIKTFEFIQDKFEGRFLKHDPKSAYYFATLITDKAEQINSKYGLAVHYPLLHKTQYYENCTLPNTERLHSKIVNLPLYDINIYNS